MGRTSDLCGPCSGGSPLPEVLESPAEPGASQGDGSLYRLDDPFLLFWYRFVAPNRSRLEMDLIELVRAEVLARLAGHVAEVWEGLARRSTPRLPLDGSCWNPGSRWWGRGADGAPLEIDVVAESTDGRHLLLGEVKWSDQADAADVLAGLVRKAQRIPFRRRRRLHYALWLKRRVGDRVDGAQPCGCVSRRR